MDRSVLSVGAVLVLLSWLSQGTLAGTERLRASLSKARHHRWTDTAVLHVCSTTSNSRDCPANEQCVANGNVVENGDLASTRGQCQCIDGYSRGAPDEPCRLAAAAPAVAPSEAGAALGSVAAADPIVLAGPQSTVAAEAVAPSRSTLLADQVTQGGMTVVLSSDMHSTTTVTPVSPSNPNSSANVSTSAPMLPKPTARVVYQLAVSAGEDVVLHYPNNTVELTARFQLPTRLQNDSLKYAWTLVQLPANTAGDTEPGVMRGLSEPTLKLAKLIPGIYRVKLVVDGANEYGECFVNITVLPPARVNQAPKAMIKPSDQQITHGNTAVLDGSESTDDEGIVGYSWEVVSAPISARIDYVGGRERQMLQLGNLVPGQYSVRLTVTDTNGVHDSATAKFTIVKEVDYPPKANAGSDVIISMPQNEVVLMGNASTDDKGIVSYEWAKAAGPHAVDISGARTPFLKLSNLQPGDYTFTLRVTDAADQSATDDVQVFVKQELNHPPVAVVLNSSILVRLLPGAAVQLDGSRSSDDHGITRYEWTQLQGPNTALLQMPDHAVATATGMIPGVYQFRLTVNDENQLKSSAVVEVQAIANINRAPVARGCGNVTVTLPRPLLVLDGSQSNDEDGHIVSYKWARELASPAAGDIVDRSDSEAVLKLAGPVAGRYVWTLTVTDDEGLSASDKCIVNILPGPNDLDTVELFLEASVEAFSEANKNSVASELSLLLRQSDGTTAAAATATVNILQVSADSLTGLLVVSFIVYDGTDKATRSMRHGTDVARMLREKLRRNADVLDFKVHSVNTLICQNNCSGHGHCSPYSKSCVCDSFWMQNVLLSYVDSESNCEWSIVYVVVIGAGVTGALALLLGLCTCACRRRCCTKQPQEKRRVYQLIDCLDADESKSSLIPKRRFMLSEDSSNNNIPKSDTPSKQQSLLLSESELSSDEDTLFVNSSSAIAKAKWSPPGVVDSRETAALTGSGNDASRA